MMAIERFFSEVSETGIDPYKLGHWCWMKVGSGDKATRIVMVYQPSGSKSSVSAGTAMREQHERNFRGSGQFSLSTYHIFRAIDCPACHLETN